ncbi:MAG: hypothetical protein C4542_07395, partial [Dehalococcoidia bacterium]
MTTFGVNAFDGSPLVLLTVLGTNGAGKSTVLRAVAEQGESVVAGYTVPLTAVRNFGIVLIGDYLTPSVKIPGVDRIGSKIEILNALEHACIQAKKAGYWAVAWEGVMLHTRQYHLYAAGRGLRTCYYVLRVPLETAFARIQARGGKAPAS